MRRCARAYPVGPAPRCETPSGRAARVVARAGRVAARWTGAAGLACTPSPAADPRGPAARDWLRAELGAHRLTAPEIAACSRAWDDEIFGAEAPAAGAPARDAVDDFMTRAEFDAQVTVEIDLAPDTLERATHIAQERSP